MKKVQRSPRELLGLLGMVGEQPPSILLDDYQATVETIDLAISSLPIEEEFTTTLAATTGSTAEVLVPTNQVWFVSGVQASITLIINSNETQMSLLWSGGFLAEKFWRGGTTTVGTGGSGTLTFGPVISGGTMIIARAGQAFTCRIDQTIGAANKDITCLVRFRRVFV